MPNNANTANKISFFQDQLTSLLSLVRMLPTRKFGVLLALLHYLQPDSLKSTANRNQIERFTGLGKRTIYTYIQEFVKCGLIKEWRGPFETKQKFYRINLPAADEVFDFYRGAETKLTSQQICKRKHAAGPTDDATQQTESVVANIKEATMNDDFSTLESARQTILSKDSRLGSPDPLMFGSSEAHTNPEAAGDVSQCGNSSSEPLTPDHLSESYGANDQDSVEPGYSKEDDRDEDSYFPDPRLDLLVDQVEKGNKLGTRLFRWLKSERLLLFWPPTDSYRVDKQSLKTRVKTLDDLNAILTAPIKPEHQWFVQEFLQTCADHAYKAKDTSNTYAFEINMRLDEMFKPSNQGRALWTVESIRVHLKMIISQWNQLQSWSQLRVSVDQPAEPTLKFLINNPGVWEAARARCIDEQEAKMRKLFERYDEPTAAIG